MVGTRRTWAACKQICTRIARSGPYMVLDWRALARESATEEGPQEGIQDRRHSIDMWGV